MKKDFNFKFLNKVMYLAVLIVLFYVSKNLGIIDKLMEINSALIPVYAGIVVCIISMPFANKLHKIGMNRKWAAIVALLFIYSIIAIVFTLVIPVFIEQLTQFISNFPEIYTNIVTKLNDFMHNSLGVDPTISITTDLDKIPKLSLFKQYSSDILSYSISTLQNVLGVIISIFTTIVVSFFMVKDMDKFKQAVIDIFSNKGRNKPRFDLIINIEKVLMSYIRGVTLDSIIVGILTATLCFVLKIDYAIVFGLLITFLNFIPYIGALLSEVIIALYALTIGGPVFALMTLMMLIVIQLIDANILQPNIVAKSVDLHPIVVFAGLIVGNLLLGIFGMVIVVPILAVIKIIIKYKSEKKTGVISNIRHSYDDVPDVNEESNQV